MFCILVVVFFVCAFFKCYALSSISLFRLRCSKNGQSFGGSFVDVLWNASQVTFACDIILSNRQVFYFFRFEEVTFDPLGDPGCEHVGKLQVLYVFLFVFSLSLSLSLSKSCQDSGGNCFFDPFTPFTMICAHVWLIFVFSNLSRYF